VYALRRSPVARAEEGNMKKTFVVGLVSSLMIGCGGQALVTADGLPVRRVIVYRNGVAYFERSGHVDESEVRFKMKRSEVGDFLATLAVMERGGSSVQAATFPLTDYDEVVDQHRPLTDDEKKNVEVVRLALDGKAHDLQVSYVAESPVWKPSYRLVVRDAGKANLQAWGIVENMSGEDWTHVKLSLVAGAPVTFRANLGTPVIPARPEVNDNGEVIAAVPHAETSLEQDATAPSSFGGGLGLSGMGEGGGGRGEGIGLGSGQGFGNGHGRLGGAHMARAPSLREGAVTVNGRLPPEVIQRIVRQNFGRFRLCYTEGVRSNPSLQGRVAVKFVIDRSGSVSFSADAGSDLPDPSVVSCIVRGFGNLSFPQPEGGMVTVVFPMIFNPGDDGGASSQTEQSQPRNVEALADISVKNGVTGYDLPMPVTIPNKSATMVMLFSQPVAGEALFLFAPEDAVAESASHPFRVVRFANETRGLLERGPIAVYQDGAFLGQGMVDPLPSGATGTVPFALERALSVDTDRKTDELGERVVKIQNGELTIERDRVTQTKYHVESGTEMQAKLMVKHPRAAGTRLSGVPRETEDNVGTGSALVPMTVAPHTTTDLVVEERETTRFPMDWFSAIAETAVKAYVADPKSDSTVVQKLSPAWAFRTEIVKKRDERSGVQSQSNDLSQTAEEARRNLRAIEKNKAADALRQKLTARLTEISGKLDEVNKKLTEIDARLAELRVQFTEAVRAIQLVVPVSKTP
jgi:hypothetical protein